MFLEIFTGIFILLLLILAITSNYAGPSENLKAILARRQVLQNRLVQNLPTPYHEEHRCEKKCDKKCERHHERTRLTNVYSFSENPGIATARTRFHNINVEGMHWDEHNKIVRMVCQHHQQLEKALVDDRIPYTTEQAIVIQKPEDIPGMYNRILEVTGQPRYFFTTGNGDVVVGVDPAYAQALNNIQ